jgi:hypothetical protein
MAFTYKLEQEDGTPADPPTFQTAVPTWHLGDTIPLAPGRTFSSSRLGRDPVQTMTPC